jgi:hypothetical protein
MSQDKIIKFLEKRGWIINTDSGWRLTDLYPPGYVWEGYRAEGMDPPNGTWAVRIVHSPVCENDPVWGISDGSEVVLQKLRFTRIGNTYAGFVANFSEAGMLQ